jgi:hypothetical protein
MHEHESPATGAKGRRKRGRFRVRLGEEIAHLARHAPKRGGTLIDAVEEPAIFVLTVVLQDRTNEVKVSEHVLDPVVIRVRIGYFTRYVPFFVTLIVVLHIHYPAPYSLRLFVFHWC